GDFEVVTSAALAIGLVVMNFLKPGAGVHAHPSSTDVSDKVSGFIAEGKASHWYDPIVHAIPDSVVGAFATNNVFAVLLFAVLFGVAVNSMGEAGRPITAAIDRISQALFGVVRLVMYAAPLGAFGAMAFTVGKY